jgi:hypothetical protein
MVFQGEPIYIEVPSNDDLKRSGANDRQISHGGNYSYCITSDLQSNKQVKIVFVLIDNDTHHPRAKKELDQLGLCSQFLLYKNISKKIKTFGVWSNILKQVNAKCGLDLYRINYSNKIKNSQTMVIGVDVVNMGANCVVGMTASYNESLTQFYSEVALQDLHKDKIGKDITKADQEEMICKERKDILQQFIG